MPYEVLEFTKAMYDPSWFYFLLYLYTLMNLMAHSIEEFVYFPVDLLVGLQSLAGTLRIRTLFENVLKLGGAHGCDFMESELHNGHKAFPLFFNLKPL